MINPMNTSIDTVCIRNKAYSESIICMFDNNLFTAKSGEAQCYFSYYKAHSYGFFHKISILVGLLIRIRRENR